MLTLIENGEIYAPELIGKGSVLLVENQILKVGEINRRAVESLDVEFEVINARNCLITPGFIDPHQHLLGGSGEEGFSTQTPEISATEIISAGITTVVGCLGVDTTMKTLPGLLAKAKGLKEEGLNAFIWTGGYNVPPTTISKSARDDIMFIEEVIGAGEIAISDERSTEPDFHELAHLTHDAYVGGMLSKKAGVTHFHVGETGKRLHLLRDLLDKDDCKPEWLYPTHITRSEELMLEAIELAARGSFVDIDTVNEDLLKWLKFYKDHGGDMKKLTVSSDSSITSPLTFFEQIRSCIVEHKFPLEEVIPLVTANTAKVLKLDLKGSIEAGKSADCLVLEKDSFELREVIVGGRRLLKNGKIAFKEAFLKDSNRSVSLTGEKKLKKARASKVKSKK
ncbi:MAG TPA: amidohydrolase family protein [Pyrinomonadaceae bacterium]|jgi:beta-aspartyl-dipeptidase (metallo-type)